MKTAAIIAEYNPFHNGHQYHIEETRRLTGADYILVLMSGNFVQRGGPAVIDKYARTRMALEGGADVVFELPVCFASSGAEYFAKGAVMLLDLCGCVDFLSFGSESGTPELFQMLSGILIKEPDCFRQSLKEALHAGQSFPAARAEALARTVMQNRKSCFPLQDPIHCFTAPEALSEFLKSPNNILGLEYIKALQLRGSRIRPFILPRKGAGYHSSDLHGEFCSATAVRTYYEALAAGCTIKSDAIRDPAELLVSFHSRFSNLLPETTRKLLTQAFQVTAPIPAEAFSMSLRCLCMTTPETELSQIFELGSELAARIGSLAAFCGTFEAFIDRLKPKQITRTRISRGLFHLLFGLHQTEMKTFFSDTGYLRLLGFKQSAAPLLKQIKHSSSVPVITKPAAAERLFKDFSKTAPEAAICRRMFQLDLLSARLYHQAIASCYHTVSADEYQRGPIRLET